MSGRKSNSSPSLLTVGILAGVGVVAGAAIVGSLLSPSSPSKQLKVTPERCSKRSPTNNRGNENLSLFDSFTSSFSNPKDECLSPNNALIPSVKIESSPVKNSPSPNAPIAADDRDLNCKPACKICGNEFCLEPSITLDCCHVFHRKCLFSSYIVQTQMNKNASFLCPIDRCQQKISDRIFESLVAFH